MEPVLSFIMKKKGKSTVAVWLKRNVFFKNKYLHPGGNTQRQVYKKLCRVVIVTEKVQREDPPPGQSVNFVQAYQSTKFEKKN